MKALVLIVILIVCVAVWLLFKHRDEEDVDITAGGTENEMSKGTPRDPKTGRFVKK